MPLVKFLVLVIARDNFSKSKYRLDVNALSPIVDDWFIRVLSGNNWLNPKLFVVML